MICECGKEFKKRVHNQKYCCPECGDLIHRRNYRIKHGQQMECKVCGSYFIPTLENYRYCSSLCEEIGLVYKERETREIELLRRQVGMRPCPKPDFIRCLKCDRKFFSENPSAQRLCGFCNITNKSYLDPQEYGRYRGPGSREVRYDRSCR